MQKQSKSTSFNLWMLNTFPKFSIIRDDETSTLFSGVFDRDESNEMWKAVNKKTTEAGLNAYLSIKDVEVVR